jgi:hypothetical protein
MAQGPYGAFRATAVRNLRLIAVASPARSAEYPYLRTAAEIGAHVDSLAEREALLVAATAVPSPPREALAELERVRFEMTAYLELLEELDSSG